MPYKDPEKRKEYAKNRYIAKRKSLNPDYIHGYTTYGGKPKMTSKEYRERIKEISREWAKNNRNKINEYRRTRWANDISYRNKCIGQNKKQRLNIKPEELELVLDLYNQECFYCGNDDRKKTIEHLIPKSKGGKDVLSNFVPACKSCNSKRWNLDLGVFYERLPLS